MTDFQTKLITAEELAYPNGGAVPALSQYEFVPQPGPFVNMSNDKVEGATQIGPIDPVTGKMGFPDPADNTRVGVRLICTNDPNLQDAGTRYWLVRRRMQGQPLQEWAILVSTADLDVLPLNQATRVTSIGTTISAGIRVNEVDGSPDVSGVTQVTFGNGTVTDMGGGHVQVAGGGGGGGGTVTSVGLTMPNDYNVAGSPVTGAGTLAVTATNQAANQVKAGPATGAAAAPTYRALVPADLPAATTSAQGATVLATPSSDVTAGHVVQANDARLSDSRAPTGAAGGDLSGTYPNPVLAAAGTAGTYAYPASVTTDSKGRVTAVTGGSNPILQQRIDASFTATGYAYYMAAGAETWDQGATPNGTFVYDKAVAGALGTFSSATLPVTLAQGDVLRINCSALANSYGAIVLKRTA